MDAELMEAVYYSRSALSRILNENGMKNPRSGRHMGVKEAVAYKANGYECARSSAADNWFLMARYTEDELRGALDGVHEIKSQEELTSDREMDMRAAREGYNPNR